MKILIVDDSKTMRMIIHRTLKKCAIPKFTVAEADNGLTGLERVEEFKPDVVLSDWNMPEMDGLDFLKNLRADRNPVQFGFVTTECTNEVREAAAAAGAAFFITKPFTAEKLEYEFGTSTSKPE